MRLTKFGHSCLLIEEGSARLLLDPGSYSTGFEDLKGLDAILITHEHGDHFVPETLKKLAANNPGVRIITNPAVNAALTEEDISSEVLPANESTDIKGVKVEAFGEKHALIHRSMDLIDNVGFLIAGRFFYPGDAFTIPPHKVEILGAPLVAPWLKISEAMDYIKDIAPKTAIAMHDGILKNPGLAHFVPENVAPTLGINFRVLEPGKAEEL